MAQVPPSEIQGPPAGDTVMWDPATGTADSPPAGDTVQGQPIPQRNFIQKGWAHFLGQDVQDPQAWPRLATIITGSVAGGMAGGRIAGLPGAVVGSTGGGLTGAIAPEVAMELGQAVGLVGPNTRAKYGLTNDELKTYLEGEALVDIATGGGVAAARLGGRVIARTAAGVGRAGTALAEDAAKEGIALLPVQVGDGKVARMYVNVLGKFGFMKPGIEKGVSASMDRYNEAIASLPERLAPVASSSDLGLKVLTDVKDLVTSKMAAVTAAEKDIIDRGTQAGIVIDPISAVNKAQDLITELTQFRPGSGAGQAAIALDPQREVTRQFIQDTISPMLSAANEKGVRTFAPQSLASITGALDSIEAQTAKFAKAKNGIGMNAMEELKTQLLQDLHQNARGPYTDAAGNILSAADRASGKQSAKNMIAEWDANAKDTTDTIAQLSNVAAEHLGIDPLKWSTLNVGKAPTINIADILVKDDGLAVTNNLAKITKPDTFREVAANVIERRLQATHSLGEGGAYTIDMKKFRKEFGLDDLNGPRYAQTDALLKNSGTPLDMKFLQRMADIGDAVYSVDIPRTSEFAARRGILGGAGSIGGASAIGIAIHGIPGGAVAGSLFVVGSRAFSKMISNPNSAVMLSSAARADVSSYVARLAVLRAFQVATRGAADMTPELINKGIDGINAIYDEVDKFSKANLGR